MFRIFRVLIDFPALDRLMNYLEAEQQKDIDSATARINEVAQRLKTARERLSEIEKENQ